jgi:flagellar hook-basal body complex protein FliE
MTGIAGIEGRSAAAGIQAVQAPGKSEGPGTGNSFSGTLAKALDAVNTLQLQAQSGSQSLANGTAANVHDVTIAIEQASIALQLTSAVRNKVVEAYQEVMRMSV